MTTATVETMPEAVQARVAARAGTFSGATAVALLHALDDAFFHRQSDAIQSLQENVVVGEMSVVAVVGGLAWVVAVVAAAVAYRGIGAPALVSVLLGLSLVVVSHPPPIRPGRAGVLRGSGRRARRSKSTGGRRAASAQ
jgi:hypothetical protein